MDGATASAAPPADGGSADGARFALDAWLTSALTSRLLATSGEVYVPRAPFTGEPLAELPLSRPDDAANAVTAARRAQRPWAEESPERRASVLLRFHDLLLAHQSEALDLIQRESGKARLHAFEELAHLALTARYYGRLAGAQLAPERRRGALPLLTRVEVRQVPVGVVGVISPWNYPLTMAVADGLAALAAGNAVVVKPDLQAAFTALWAARLLDEAGLPDGLWRVVAGDGTEVGPAVVAAVDHVCFTGSTRTGALVAQQAAARLVGASLALGGKNPMLVLRDAVVDRAVEGAVHGCFSSAGQLCVATERLYVADQVYDRFVSRFVERAGALRLSAGLDFSADMGSLATRAQLDRVVGHVEDARAKGAVVLVGGRARPDIGPLFYEPTVLAGVRPGMEVFSDETFGPVVSVYRFADERDAVARANEGTYGLNASVFTADARRGREIARRIRCGTVSVNDAYAASFASIDAPMGGMGQSGLGRRQGVEGLRRFTDPQSIVTERMVPLRPLLGMSGAAFVRSMTGVLRALKALRRP